MTRNERMLFLAITGHLDGYLAETEESKISVKDFLAYVETVEDEMSSELAGNDPQADLNPSGFVADLPK